MEIEYNSKTAENYFAFNILEKRIQAFLAFSFFTNGMKLFSVQKQNSAGMIGCINGIRALSSIWVVLFHSVMVYKVVPIQNIQTYSTVGLFNYDFILNWFSIILLYNLKFNAEYHSMMIYSGRIAVDTFLVLSGLLITMSMLKSFEKYVLEIKLLKVKSQKIIPAAKNWFKKTVSILFRFGYKFPRACLLTFSINIIFIVWFIGMVGSMLRYYTFNATFG